ncbi:PREDICTED: B-box zinc finger protein 22 [Nelumbo nucifera]|uniref:B-box zinc finger protein 22 n=1 Tax=Nelumbo nucifera TaxID=4432 RepID=A0A1U7ZTP1_NELNU|nr:PREDICTED: B-box zinc finger protein 22 [Nelumbo nucifera]
MKIQCDVCEKVEAAVLCCADEAALCWGCDEKVHAANKLAGKHQRLPLLNPSSHVPSCDICQEKVGYFFCLEDRALLCRQCDVSIHTVSPYVSSHQRFLVTGVKVALQHSSNSDNINSNGNSSNGGNYHLSPPTSNASSADLPTNKKVRLSLTRSVSTSASTPASLSDEPTLAIRPNWPLDEILNSSDYDCCYGFSDLGSSRIGSQ